MAENTLALLQYLSSEGSPIPRLTGGYTKPTTAFFSFFNTFFVQYSFQTANALHVTLFVSTILFIVTTYSPRQQATNPDKNEKPKTVQNGRAPSNSRLANGHAYDSRDNIWIEYIKGVGILTASAIGSLLGVCSVAFVMAILINRPLSWFALESSCLILYAPASLTGKNFLVGQKQNTLIDSSRSRCIAASQPSRKTYTRTHFTERRSPVTQSSCPLNPSSWDWFLRPFLPIGDPYPRRTSSGESYECEL